MAHIILPSSFPSLECHQVSWIALLFCVHHEHIWVAGVPLDRVVLNPVRLARWFLQILFWRKLLHTVPKDDFTQEHLSAATCLKCVAVAIACILSKVHSFSPHVLTQLKSLVTRNDLLRISSWRAMPQKVCLEIEIIIFILFHKHFNLLELLPKVDVLDDFNL